MPNQWFHEVENPIQASVSYLRTFNGFNFPPCLPDMTIDVWKTLSTTITPARTPEPIKLTCTSGLPSTRPFTRVLITGLEEALSLVVMLLCFCLLWTYSLVLFGKATDTQPLQKSLVSEPDMPSSEFTSASGWSLSLSSEWDVRGCYYKSWTLFKR